MYTARNLEDALSAPNETAQLLLSGHGITDFPREIFQLQNLEVLDLSQNLLRDLPPEIQFLSKLKNIQLRNNQLRQLPEEIGNLQVLERIDCSINQLSSLPQSLLQATSLREILIDSNCFEAFPTVELPASLNSISIANNQISEIPDSIRRLFKLNFVDLRHNRLSSVPVTLTLLQDLEHLKLAGNPIDLATDFADPEEQLSHFFREFRRHTNNLDEARLWLHLLQGQTNEIKDQAKSLLLASLNCPIDAIRKCAANQLPSIIENPLINAKNGSFMIAGQVSMFRKSEGKEVLEAQGLSENKRPKDNSTIIILADRPEKSLSKALANGNPIALEAHLAKLVVKTKGQFLGKEAVLNPMTENLKRLIRSYKKENIEMAMVMMGVGGLPANLLSDLLAIGLFHPEPSTAKKALETFKKEAASNLRVFVERQVQIHVDAEGELQIEPLLKALKRNATLDIEALVAAAIGMKGFQRNLLLLLSEASRLPFYESRIQNGLLDLSSMNLSSFPSGIANFKELQYLKLARNIIEKLPDQLQEFSQLKMLDLSENKLSELPENIRALNALTRLDLAHNQLSTLPEGFSELQSLEALRIDSNPFYELPKSIESLENLELLGCYRCKLSSLSDGIWALPALRSLDLGECNFKELPDEMQGLRLLESLVLRENPLQRFPEWLGELPNLRFLDLSMLPLPYLPENLHAHPKIERLFLIREESMNWEQVLPILASLPNLQYVYFRGRHIVRHLQLQIEDMLPKVNVRWNG